jgi:hypothetical protein
MKSQNHCLDVGNYNLTMHAKNRLQQRGLSARQVELVMAHGTPVEDGYVMTKIAATDRITELKREMKDLERLKNVAVIDLKGVVVTVYRVSDRRIRRMTAK